MNNYMVTHLWANEKKESARGSNFFFEGESIYSYGYHFEVGRIVRNKRGEKAYLINNMHRSNSTSMHQYYVRQAIPTGSKVGQRWAFNCYENDMLTAGCHRIAYSEMEDVARQLGWD